MPGRVTSLFRNLLIYGAGDTATSLVSLLLLPLFTRHLTPDDYGVIAMLLMIEAVSKVVLRWGVDTAFMRLYYDCPDQAARQRLASTIFFFLLATNAAVVLGAIGASGWLSGHLFGTPAYAVLIALTIANTFIAGFHFMPYHVFRIRGQSTQFIALAFTRSATTLVARLLLVLVAGLGVFGLVLADIIVTSAFTVLLSRWIAPLIRPVFSLRILKDALRFGLPRVPHSLASQVVGFADRYFLNTFARLADVGLYSIGATFGLALKLFLSGFEAAWTPFFLGVMHEPDARTIYKTTSTYILAVLVLLVAGLSAIAADLIRLFTAPAFHQAAAVTPWIAIGVLFQGIYLVGSIGLVIEKRTMFYPLATGLAGVASVLANLLLVPRFGYLGAAWANAIAYGTLTAVTVTFSQRVYPISYEWPRLLRVGTGGLLAYAAGVAVPLGAWPSAAGLIGRGAIVVVIYLAVLKISGFFHPGELAALNAIRLRALSRPVKRASVSEPVQVEMGGEIAASGPEPVDADVSGDSRSQPR